LWGNNSGNFPGIHTQYSYPGSRGHSPNLGKKRFQNQGLAAKVSPETNAEDTQTQKDCHHDEYTTQGYGLSGGDGTHEYLRDSSKIITIPMAKMLWEFVLFPE
jgi:hypothetical protein